MVRRYLGILGLLFIVVGLFLQVHATTLSSSDVSQLSVDANWIGRIQIDEVSTISSSAKFPTSVVKAKVLEVLKGSGDVGGQVSFEIPGGMRGTKTFAVVGFPQFKPGGQYVVFLASSPFTSARALSLGMGVGLMGWTAFRVMRREQGASSEAVVMRVGEPTLLQKSARGLAISHDRSVKTYGDFVSEIYRALN